MKNRSGPLLIMIACGILLVVAAAAGLLAQSGAFNFAYAGPPRVGATMADFTLPEIDGRSIRLSDYSGRPVLINIWATWCPPCVAEMPYLNDFFLSHEQSGFMVLAINSGESVDTAAAFAIEQNLAFPVLTDPNSAFTDQLSVHNFPTSILIGADGVVKAIHVGMYTPEDLDVEVLPLLER